MTPTQLPNETDKQFEAFKLFCKSDKPSVSKVAKELTKSRQLIGRWASKNGWKRRLAAMRQREAESKIQAEKRSHEAIATISEAEKASAWRSAFELAARFLEHAEKIYSTSPGHAATLAKTAFTILDSVRGGIAGGFQVNVGVVNAAEKQFPSIAFDDAGKPVKEVDFIRSYEQALKIINAGEVAALPCDNWSPDSIDATPVFTEPEPEVAQMSNSKPGRCVPSRMAEECPTSDGVGPGEGQTKVTSATPFFHKMLDDINAPDI